MEKFLATRNDGVRVIACEACLDLLQLGGFAPIVECVDVALTTPCQTEAFRGAWNDKIYRLAGKRRAF